MPHGHIQRFPNARFPARSNEEAKRILFDVSSVKITPLTKSIVSTRTRKMLNSLCWRPETKKSRLVSCPKTSKFDVLSFSVIRLQLPSQYQSYRLPSHQRAETINAGTVHIRKQLIIVLDLEKVLPEWFRTSVASWQTKTRRLSIMDSLKSLKRFKKSLYIVYKPLLGRTSRSK